MIQTDYINVEAYDRSFFLSEMLCVIKHDAVYVRQMFAVIYFVFVICLCVLAILLTIVVLHLHLRADSKPTTAMPAWVRLALPGTANLSRTKQGYVEGF